MEAMKISQKKLIMVYNAIGELTSAKMPVKTALSLYRLKQTLEPAYQAEASAERKLVEDYGAVVGGGGRVDFPNAESREGFIQSMVELNSVEIEVELEKPVISTAAIDGNVTMQTIEALDGFVVFEP